MRIDACMTHAFNIALIYALSRLVTAPISGVWLGKWLGCVEKLGIAMAFADLMPVVI